MTRQSRERRSIQAYLTLQKRILRRLIEAGPKGMNRSSLYSSLGSPITKASLEIALNALKHRGKAQARRVETGTRGRPSEVWWAAGLVPEHLR